MRPYALACLLCGISVLLAQSIGATTRPLVRVTVDGRKTEVVNGEVLVKFHAGTPAERIDAIVDTFGTRERRKGESFRFVLIRLNDPASLESAIEELRAAHGVEAAEPNYVYRILDQAAPDPLLPEQWSLPNIHAPEAWGRALGAQMIVAVIDTGAQLDHPDLRGRLRSGYDFIDDDNDPSDPNGHGTMAAGLIAANRDNGTGISGVAPEASVLPLRAADAGGIATASDLAEAILFAVDKKVDVINLSLGGPDRSAILEEAVRIAVAEGIVVCASVGNSGAATVLYPAAYPGVVGVGASTRDGEVWTSSNTGDGVDFVAPGVGIVSTTIEGGYAKSNGSSLATAIFSGAVAVVLSSRKGMVAVEAVGRLGSTATDVGEEGADTRSGHGIPNLAAALAIDVPEVVDVAVSSITLESRRVKKKTAPRVEVELANRGRTKSVTADVIVEVNGEAVGRRNGVVVRRETKVEIELVAPPDKGTYRIAARAIAAGDANAANDTASLNLSILPDPDATYVILYKNEPFVHTWVAYQAMQILQAGTLKTELSNNFFGTATYAGLFSYSAPYSPPGPPSSWTSSSSSGTSVAEGTWEEDEDDYDLGIPQFLSGDSFLQHFWNPDSGIDTGLPNASTICLTTGPYHSAMYTAQQWWNLAIQRYASGQTASAYYALGRVAHLLGDMGVPEHVHLDPHPGNEGSICTDLDDYSNYEEYTAAAYRNYSGSGSPKVIENLLLATPSFTTSSYEPLLVRLFYNQAQFTQHSDSANVNGSNSGASAMGVTADGGSKNQSYSAVGYLDWAPDQDRMDLDYTPTITWCDIGITGCTWRSLSEGGSSGNYYDLARAYGQIAPSSGLWSQMNNTFDYLRITYRYNGVVKTDDIVNFRDSTTYYSVPDRFMLSGPQSQMDRLFPENIRYIAGLYQVFWDTTHPTVTVTATDNTATESGPTTGQFKITRTGGIRSALSVNVTISGTASSGSDYAAISSPVVIPAGAAFTTVTVTPVNDSAIESDETVILTIASGGSAYSVGSPSSATVTIQSDDVATPSVTVTATDNTATEAGTTTGQFTITRGGGSSASALSVNISVGGTATSGSDYTAVSSPVTIPANSASTTVTVTPINDSSVESDETVILTITSGSGYTVGSPSQATVTITSDDVATTTVTLSATDTTATEPGGTGQFTITRSGGSTSSSLSVNVNSGGTATAGSDYSALSTPVVIPANASFVNVLVVPIDDLLVESDETVTLSLASGSGYSIGSPSSGTVTIQSDDVAPTTVTIVANDSIATELGATTGQFTVTRSGGSVSSSLSINLSIDGTASNGSDYSSISSTVTIPANSSSATITIYPIDDTLVEADETINLTLVSGAGYAIGNPSSASVTLQSDDVATAGVSITANDATATELGTTTGQFTVTRTGGSFSFALTVNLSIGGSATNGSDYDAVSSQVTIPANASSALVTVMPIDDGVFEDDETVVVSIEPGGGYSVGSPSQATVTISSDDSQTVCSLVSIGCPYSANGTLTTSSCSDGTYYNGIYSFLGSSGSTVTIDATSAEFDTYIFLVSPDGWVVAVDDDSGEGTNSHLVYTFDVTGTWYLFVSTYWAGETGNYQLTLSGCAPLTPVGVTVDTVSTFPRSAISVISADTLVNGRAYFFGGQVPNTEPYQGTNVVDIYDTNTGTWSRPSTQLPYGMLQYNVTATYLNSHFYISPTFATGDSNGWGSHNKIVDVTVTGATAERAAFAYSAIWGVGSVQMNGKVYFLGGHTGSDVAGIYEYDPPTNQLNLVASMLYAGNTVRAIEGSDGYIYFWPVTYAYAPYQNVIQRFHPMTRSVEIVAATLPYSGNGPVHLMHDPGERVIYFFQAGQDPYLYKYDYGTGVMSSTGAYVPGIFGGAPATMNPANPKVAYVLGATPADGNAPLYRVMLSRAGDLAAPTNLQASALSPTSVALTWSGVAGATYYDIARASDGGVMRVIASVSGPAYTDTLVSPGRAYVYRVRSRSASASGPYSNPDLATTVMFSDDPLVARQTKVRSTHLTELRTAVNAVRITASLPPLPWTDSAGVGTLIRRIHVEELRAGLLEALTTLTLPWPTFTDVVLQSQSPIKVVHIQQLRGGVK